MWKQSLIALALICVLSLGSAEAQTDSLAKKTKKAVTAKGLAAVCKTIRGFKGGEIYKSIASTHIPSSDPRRYSTSFITLRSTGAPSATCLGVYDSKGKLVHKLGRYFPTGAAYSSRFYGGTGCGDRKRPSQVVSAARSNTGQKDVYLAVGRGVCLKISDPLRCVNSAAC